MLPWLLLLIMVLKVHLPWVMDPYRIDGDARQHVFWTHKFTDPELFPGDPLVEFISSPRFDPLGYQALYYAGVQVVDPLLLSKLLGAGLSLILGALAFRVGRRTAGPLAGTLCLLAMAFLSFDDQRIALPRAFAFCILILAILAVIEHRPLLAGLSLVLSALFYPPAVLSVGVLFPLLLLREGGTLPIRVGRLLLPVGMPALVALTVILLSTRFIDADLTGNLVTRAQSLEMPEFHEGGRNVFWREDPVAFYLGGGGYSRSACDLLASEIYVPLLVVLVLLVVLRRRFICPPVLLVMTVSSALLFVLAHAVLFTLYQPNRYTAFTWPTALGLLVGINLATVLSPWLRRFQAPLLRGAFPLAALLLLTIIASAVTRKSAAPEEATLRLHAVVGELPKDVLLAGHPRVLDDIPLRSLRSVLINRELSLAWYQGYYQRIKPRIEANLALLWGSDGDVARAHVRTYGVTHLIVRDGDVRESSDTLAASVERPFDERVRELRATGTPPWWAAESLPVLFEGGGLRLLDLRKLR
jgi:hypothetical protein